MLRKALYTYPNVNRSEIIDLIQHAEFIKVDSEQAFQTIFFQKFKDRYNGIPVFSRYKCKDSDKFKRSIPFLLWNQLKFTITES